jgi:arylsulfatase A-like enzyme
VPRDKWTPPGPRRLGFDRWAVHNCTHEYNNSFYYADTDERIPIPGYEPQFQAHLAMEFMEDHAGEPWCLVLSWGTPHNPYETAPPRFRAMYPPEEIELRGNVPEEKAEVARREIAGYWAHITALDEQMGRLMERLDALGLAEETLVVFTSDHGDMLHSQGRTRKQQPWEESILVPLIVRGPGVPAGREYGGLIGIVDVAPSILGVMGLGGQEAMAGRDLSATWRGESEEGVAEVYLMDIFPVDEGWRLGVTEWRGLRTARWTYARTLDGPWVLYDNEGDPLQVRNVAGEAAYAETLSELEARRKALEEASGDTFVPLEEFCRRWGLVEAWNAREKGLQWAGSRIIGDAES